MNVVKPLWIGDKVPNFVGVSQLGKFDFHESIEGKWCMLFSHPADFTPVCLTELSLVAQIKDQFEKRNVKIFGLSIDSVDSHRKFIDDVNELSEGDEVQVDYPVIADEDGTISRVLGLIPESATGSAAKKAMARSLLVIDPLKNIQLSLTYPVSTGRNFNEILRTLDALQVAVNYKVATPANWKLGEDVVILPDVTEEEAKSLFPKGFIAIKPYLRVTSQPTAAIDVS